MVQFQLPIYKNNNDKDYIMVKDLRLLIKLLRRHVDENYANLTKAQRAAVQMAYNDIVLSLYRVKLDASDSVEEHKEILEMPGDFVIGRITDATNEFVTQMDAKYFNGWGKDGPIIGDRAEFYFDFESMAKAQAEKLKEVTGEEWEVWDWSEEEIQTNSLEKQQLLVTLFGDKISPDKRLKDINDELMLMLEAAVKDKQANRKHGDVK